MSGRVLAAYQATPEQFDGRTMLILALDCAAAQSFDDDVSL
jgi:hypothetical protein